MKVIYKTKTITEKVFVAIDGKEFLSEQACKEHEEYLNGTRKKCEKCNGTGRVNRRTEKTFDEMLVKMVDVEYSDPCPACQGKGYLKKTTEWR